jgi:ketosteroid isomerase-like protein
MTAREAFEKGTETFNAHDIDGFTGVLADDVVYRAPGGIGGQGKAACARFFAGWFGAFPDAHVEVHALHITGDVAIEEGTFTGTHDGVLGSPAGDIPPTGRPVLRRLRPGAPLPRGQACLLQPDVRPAPDA